MVTSANARMPTVSVLVVDTGYFHVMDVRIVRGRQFDAEHDPSGPMTSIVVNEALAQRLWPGENPIGKELALGSIGGERRVPVVGVARNTRNRSLRAEPGPQAYFLLSQNPTGRALLHVRVATSRQPIAAVARDGAAAADGRFSGAAFRVRARATVPRSRRHSSHRHTRRDVRRAGPRAGRCRDLRRRVL